MSDSHPARVRVTLATDQHTHAGIPRQRGEVIEVSPAAARWLAEQKLIYPTQPPRKGKTKEQANG